MTEATERTTLQQHDDEWGSQGRNTPTNAADQAETEEQGTVQQSISDEVESETTTEVTTNTDSGRSLTFQMLVQNWETYVNHGTRNVQLGLQNGLQNLSLCGVGEGLTRIGPALPRRSEGDDDPFAPIVLRHTHSSPLQYSASLVNEREQIPTPFGLDQMRRSSSTPCAFRERSAGSAFGAHLRTMPLLGGPEDRIASAFSLPMHRFSSSHASVSDSGVRYSAFDPVSLLEMDEIVEKTSIEVTDLRPNLGVAETVNDDTNNATPAIWGAARRAKSFLSDIRVLKFRERRSGRENPARPHSTSSSCKSDEFHPKDAGDNDTISTKSSVTAKEQRCSTEKFERNANAKSFHGRLPPSKISTVFEGNTSLKNKAAKKESSQYHQLEPDFDEECGRFPGVETSIADSPNTVSSPAYHCFVDDHGCASGTNESSEIVEGANSFGNSVRIDVSTAMEPHQSFSHDGNHINNHYQLDIGINSSHEPGSQSPSTSTARSTYTNNTSGHTTHATSTSATISSGRITLLSTVSETDREVMETNKAGRIMRRQQQYPGKSDGEASIHSASTTSTNTHGYLALTGSPASLRDGASLPVDRFFTQSGFPVAHSFSGNSGGSSSSGSRGAHGANTSDVVIVPGDASLASSSVPSKKSESSPRTDSSASAADTACSNSTDEDPPKFVSYLDRQRSESTKLSHDGGISTMSSQHTYNRMANVIEDRESPAEIVGYSDLVFEEAKPQASRLIRPAQKRDQNFFSRPPRSPIKGLRAPDTPPPSTAYEGPDSDSPAYQQLSPPNIVDHRMHSGHSHLSKPYVFRSAPARTGGNSNNPVLVSAEISTRSQGLATVSVRSFEPDSYIYTTNDLEGPLDSCFPQRNRTYQESNIEVEKSDNSTTHVPVVSPDKGNN